MKPTIFDFLNDLSYLKKDILTDENQAEYSPYMINKFLSMDVTTVLYANEMNIRPAIPKKIQYQYYLHAIKKSKRYFKYLKTTKEKNIDLLKEYFSYSDRRAREVLPLFSEPELEYIKNKLQKGGIDGKRKA